MSKRIVLLQALASSPADLARLVKGVGAPTAGRRPSLEMWSMAQVVSHLIDVESRCLARLRRVVSEERPFLPFIHPDEAAYDPQISFADLLTRFEGVREQTLTFLKELSPGQWQRPAVHETQGATTLRFLVQMMVDHDIQHLSQVAEIQSQLRAGLGQKAQPAISENP